MSYNIADPFWQPKDYRPAASDTSLNGGTMNKFGGTVSGIMSGLGGLVKNNPVGLAIGLGTSLIGGIAKGLAAKYQREEENFMTKQHNKFMTDTSSMLRQGGLRADMRAGQMASGGLAYMMNRTKRNPQLIGALSDTTARTLDYGANQRNQTFSMAAQYMAQRKPLLDSRKNNKAAWLTGVTSFIGNLGSYQNTFSDRG